jgi:hypothetical protein
MPHASISDLTVDELKGLIRETVGQTIREIFSDPDEGLVLREEVEERLRNSLGDAESAAMPVLSAQSVADRLGLMWGHVQS